MAKIREIALGLLLASYAFTAQAQNYPNRPVKLIVSIAAGSVADVIMRKAAAELAPKVGQQFIIENRGGANGIRSEEHTSELQSHVKLVCRLLLEKKKLNLLDHGFLRTHD